jgi:hypothetical protein
MTTSRTFSQQPAPLAGVLDQMLAAAMGPVTSPLAPGSPAARERMTIQAEVERQIQRAIWRAEKRTKRVPLHVRQSSPWVMGQRRRMARELVGALRRLGFGIAVTYQLAQKACERFPRDGIVLAVAGDREERPRARGESPRQKGSNPRARGQSPRQLGTNPRARRAALETSSEKAEG